MLTDSEWTALLTAGSRRVYHRGDRLIRLGDTGRWVAALTAGRVRVTYAESDGRQVLLAVRGPGDLLGEFSRGDGRPRSATVQAIEHCVAHLISEAAFNAVCARHGLSDRLTGYITAKLRESDRRSWRLAHRRVRARLAELLMSVIDAAGSRHDSPHIVELSQEELAEALGVVRSAVTPVLAEWRRTGLVRVERAKVIVVDRTAIRRLAAQ